MVDVQPERFFEIFKINPKRIQQVEYMSHILRQSASFNDSRFAEEVCAAWKQQGCICSAMLMGIFFVVASILHFTNIEHYPRLLGYFHLFGGVSFVLIALTGYERGAQNEFIGKSDTCWNVDSLCKCCT